tara:strand:- start:217 stop:1173 length:957 start_codon:yes stop_codon:yes gene_type:complete
MASVEYSIIIPIFKNEGSVQDIFKRLEEIKVSLKNDIEVIFVNDFSPDKSFEKIYENLEKVDFKVKILNHSKNLGSFAAMRTGLIEAEGKFFSIMTADLQEPRELIVSFFKSLKDDESDVVIGQRENRKDADPIISRFFSNTFWWIYNKTIFKDVPSGGFDVFGCNSKFRDQLVSINETRSSLIGQILWLGFRRKFIKYSRLERKDNKKSGWTFIKKIDYALDSFFSFSNLPVTLIIVIGFFSFLFLLCLFFFLIFLEKTTINEIDYLSVFFIILAANIINILSTGIIGIYVWRTYENSKRRPVSIVATRYKNKKYEK